MNDLQRDVGRTVTARRFVLWLTGRDFMAPLIGKNSLAFPSANFRVTIGGNARWGLVVEAPVAPNVLHRLMQRIVLGFKWEMLP